ncbi:hypothetical protein, partial [Bacillus sp. SRB_331]|uniref:hypothetical protein n=1 Tax=Bacillus sp. SRB_331 TaxID=1969379 RepID=UPI000DC307FF
KILPLHKQTLLARSVDAKFTHTLAIRMTNVMHNTLSFALAAGSRDIINRDKFKTTIMPLKLHLTSPGPGM